MAQNAGLGPPAKPKAEVATTRQHGRQDAPIDVIWRFTLGIARVMPNLRVARNAPGAVDSRAPPHVPGAISGSQVRSLRNTMGSSSPLLQPYPFANSGEPWIGTEGSVLRIHSEIHQSGVASIDRLVQPREGLVHVARPHR